MRRQALSRWPEPSAPRAPRTASARAAPAPFPARPRAGAPASDSPCAPNPSDPSNPNEGICPDGPSDSSCSLEPYRGCLGDADCNPPPAGNCSDCFPNQICQTANRQCFLDPIVRTGTPGTRDSIIAATFCLPPTRSSSINNVAGLPGPGAVLQPTRTFRIGPLCGNGAIDTGESCDGANDGKLSRRMRDRLPVSRRRDVRRRAGQPGERRVRRHGRQRVSWSLSGVTARARRSAATTPSNPGEQCDDGNQTQRRRLRRQLHHHRLRQRHPYGKRAVRRRRCRHVQRVRRASPTAPATRTAATTSRTKAPRRATAPTTARAACRRARARAIPTARAPRSAATTVREGAEAATAATPARVPARAAATARVPRSATLTFVDPAGRRSRHRLDRHVAQLLDPDLRPDLAAISAGAIRRSGDNDCTFFANVGSFCSGNPAVSCTDNTGCVGNGSCVITQYGSPLPLSSGGVPVCILNRFAGDVTGTYNLADGRGRADGAAELDRDRSRPTPTSVSDLQLHDVRRATAATPAPAATTRCTSCTVGGVGPFGPTSERLPADRSERLGRRAQHLVRAGHDRDARTLPVEHAVHRQRLHAVRLLDRRRVAAERVPQGLQRRQRTTGWSARPTATARVASARIRASRSVGTTTRSIRAWRARTRVAACSVRSTRPAPRRRRVTCTQDSDCIGGVGPCVTVVRRVLHRSDRANRRRRARRR